MNDDLTYKPDEQQSVLMRLLSIGFGHPNRELYAAMQRGDWQGAVSSNVISVLGSTVALPLTNLPFEEFEAIYISTFDLGKKSGRGVSLHAGDYDNIIGSQSRPDLLVDYTNWYKHFGLRVDSAGAHLMPDHICCQLDLLSWLAHLEARAQVRERQLEYQRAQQDFTDRHLLPFVKGIEKRLHAHSDKGNIPPFYAALADLTAEILEHLSRKWADDTDVVNLAGNANTNGTETSQPVNLWD